MDSDGMGIAVSQEKLDQMHRDLDALGKGKVAIIETLSASVHGFGELVDNQEWQTAKNDLSEINGRIAKLEKEINAAHVVHNGGAHLLTIEIGAQVYLRDLITNGEEFYTIVGPLETVPGKHRISFECPIGERLRGCRVNDTVTVETPKGEKRLVVTAIRYE